MNVPDIEFVDTDTDLIKSNVITVYESLAGRTLASGDPVRLFLESIASIIAQQRAVINFTGKMNLLAYAKGDYLDHLGVLVGTKRIAASAAQTTLKITLSEAQNKMTSIPAGTRVTAGDGIFFATTTAVVIPAQALSVQVTAECTVVGTAGNGYLAGQLKKLVDPIPFVAEVTNITASEGGADIESDESYRQRIQTAPESFSCAGPDGAYEYHTKKVSALIGDVSVDSPTPGVVDIVVLLRDGNVPDTELINDIKAAVNDKRIRPLTDQVNVYPAELVNYDIELKYYIAEADQTHAVVIQAAVEQAVNAYIDWQKNKLGRDINPSALIARIIQAGAKRVELIEPEYEIIAKKQVAIGNTPVIQFGGLEDD